MKTVVKFQNFFDKGKHICLGLDTDIDKIPPHLSRFDDPVFEFNKQIIDSTIDEVAAYKINTAFYESRGIEGMSSMLKTVKYINSRVPVIGDAKRGDIGNTSQMYAKSLFSYFNFDAITANSYMGTDSILPFLLYEDRLTFFLVLTSNASNADIQKLKVSDGTFVYEKVLDMLSTLNSKYDIGIVFGATNPDELQKVMPRISKFITLLPGIGAQGGDLSSIVTSFTNAGNNKYLINVSRSAIYKSSEQDFAYAAHGEIKDLNIAIQNICDHNSA